MFSAVVACYFKQQQQAPLQFLALGKKRYMEGQGWWLSVLCCSEETGGPFTQGQARQFGEGPTLKMK